MRRTSLERLEDAVAEAIGPGSAVSLDRERNMLGRLAWVARAWDAKGVEKLSSGRAVPQREEAIRTLVRSLMSRPAARSEERVERVPDG
jgi:hypothetical protein